MQGSNRIFDRLCHCIHLALFSDILVTDNSVDGSFYSREVLVVILLQSVCLGNGCVYCTVICRAIRKPRIIACLRKRVAQQTCHCAIRKFFFYLFSGCTCVFRYSARSEEAVRISNRTAPPRVARKNAGSLGHSISHGRKRRLIHIAILKSQC